VIIRDYRWSAYGDITALSTCFHDTGNYRQVSELNETRLLICCAPCQPYKESYVKSRGWIKFSAMNTYSRGGMTPHILNLGTRSPFELSNYHFGRITGDRAPSTNWIRVIYFRADLDAVPNKENPYFWRESNTDCLSLSLLTILTSMPVVQYLACLPWRLVAQSVACSPYWQLPGCPAPSLLTILTAIPFV
jgi:hypothetical protein